MLTPSTIAAAIDAAPPGAVLVLAPCDYPTLRIRKRVWDVPITVVADGAVVRGLVLDGVQGLEWIGGTIMAPAGIVRSSPSGYAVSVQRSSRIRISGIVATGAFRGAVLANSTDLTVENSHFGPLGAEGINLATVSRARIIGNMIRDFAPEPTTCTIPQQVTYGAGTPLSIAGETVRGLSRAACEARGGTWKDGDHPDAIQMWGDISDVVIAGNDVAGPMHGIGYLGREGPKGLKDRVRIIGNRVATSSSNAIVLERGTAAVITGNVVSRWGGSTQRPQIRVTGTEGELRGNINPDGPKGHITVEPLP